MPTLLEIQDAVYRSLVQRDDAPASPHIRDDGLAAEARLSVYRNTFVGVLTTALRLSFPAVHRLVGADFFEGMARLFIEARPPRCAWLDGYGADFPAFVAAFQPAASLAYLPGVARLEWAVNVALHASDAPSLDLPQFAALDAAQHERVALMPRPSLGLVHDDRPVDAIWRAILDDDDAALASINMAAGPVWLLVDRRDGVEVRRLDEASWRFLQAVCAGQPVLAAIESVTEADGAAWLAEHLAAGRFSRYVLTGTGGTTSLEESAI